MVEKVISFLDIYSGPLFAAGFFCFMIWLFYWILVVAPRKIAHFFKSLEAKGYGSIGPEDYHLAELIERLVPPHPSRISRENVTSWNLIGV